MEQLKISLSQLLADDPEKFRQFGVCHPALNVHQAIEELRGSLNIFLDATDDLVESIAVFRSESRSLAILRNIDEGLSLKSLRKILNALFTASASSMALVDHTRRLAIENLKVDGYEERVASFFQEDGLHDVIQGLRNYFLHRKTLPLGFTIRSWWSEKESSAHLHRNELLSFKNWKPKAREYLEQQPENIDFEAKFNEYRARVTQFHSWFSGALEAKFIPHLTEYRLYKEMLDGAFLHGVWSRLISIARARRVDPYPILPSILSDTELSEVLSIEKRSRHQIDRIIEICDTYNICDANLRQNVHNLFGVSESPPIS